MDEDPKNLLTIDKNTGALYVNGPVDYEELKVLNVRLHMDRLLYIHTAYTALKIQCVIICKVFGKI